MDWIEALVLGLIQGLTEYLPVSSSGHLAIGSYLFGVEGEENLAFTVAVHVATVLSTLVILWKEIDWIFRGLFKCQLNEETKYVFNIIISMIPVGIVGVFFKDTVEKIFGSGLVIVGCMLFVTAALLIFSYYAKPRQKEKISIKDAFIIGLAQACAVMPGLSRSGSRIVAWQQERKPGTVLVLDGNTSHPRRGFARRVEGSEGRRGIRWYRRVTTDSGIHSGIRLGMPCLQVDDKYRQEGQTDLLRHLLRHRRSCHPYLQFNVINTQT